MKYVVLLLSLLISAEVFSADLMIPSFPIKLDGNSYTDLSKYHFRTCAWGDKYGGIMNWSYQTECKDAIKVDRGNYLIDQIEYSANPFTGIPEIGYDLHLEKNFGEKSYSKYKIRTEARANEVNEGEELLVKAKKGIYITTFPLLKEIEFEALMTIEDTSIYLSNDCKSGGPCVLGAKMVVEPIMKEGSLNDSLSFCMSLEGQSSEGNKVSYRGHTKGDQSFRCARDSSFATLGKPEAFRYFLVIKVLSKNKVKLVESNKYITNNLNNLELEKSFEEQTFNIKIKKKVKVEWEFGE